MAFILKRYLQAVRLRESVQTKITGTVMKKRYIAIGLIALDILCIPVAAQIIDRVSFSIPQHAVSTELPRNEAGVSNLVVSSNAPFILTVSNVVGEIDVTVKNSGAINSTRFGDNAQMPGPRNVCAMPTSAAPAVIYAADRRTALKRGEILSQSVIITVRFPEGAEPEFKVMPEKQGRGIPHAGACEPVQS